MSDLLMLTGGDIDFDQDILFANSKEAIVQSVIATLRTYTGDNQYLPSDGTLVPLRHGMAQNQKTGLIIKSDVETGLMQSGTLGPGEFSVDVFPTSASAIRVSVIIDPQAIFFSGPITVDFNYDVGTGEVEHLNGAIE